MLLEMMVALPPPVSDRRGDMSCSWESSVAKRWVQSISSTPSASYKSDTPLVCIHDYFIHYQHMAPSPSSSAAQVDYIESFFENIGDPDSWGSVINPPVRPSWQRWRWRGQTYTLPSPALFPSLSARLV